MAANARFLPDEHSLLADLRDGPRFVYNGTISTLPWSTTYDELAQKPFVRHQEHHAFGWPVYFIDVALRLGTLEMQGIEINMPNGHPQSRIRSDVPVDGYDFEVRLAEKGAESYQRLRKYFGRALGKPNQAWAYPNDQVHADWLYSGLQISLTYWFKSMVERPDWDYTGLSINNHRVYPQYLTDPDTNQFGLERPTIHWQTFAVPNVSVPHNYRTSRYVRFTPALLREQMQQRRHSLAVWYDEQAQKMGVAQSDYALVMPLPDATRLVLETIDYDRGQYGDELTLSGLPNGQQVLVTAPVGAINLTLATLRQWLNG